MSHFIKIVCVHAVHVGYKKENIVTVDFGVFCLFLCHLKIIPSALICPQAFVYSDLLIAFLECSPCISFP